MGLTEDITQIRACNEAHQRKKAPLYFPHAYLKYTASSYSVTHRCWCVGCNPETQRATSPALSLWLRRSSDGVRTGATG